MRSRSPRRDRCRCWLRGRTSRGTRHRMAACCRWRRRRTRQGWTHCHAWTCHRRATDAVTCYRQPPFVGTVASEAAGAEALFERLRSVITQRGARAGWALHRALASDATAVRLSRSSGAAAGGCAALRGTVYRCRRLHGSACAARKRHAPAWRRASRADTSTKPPVAVLGGGCTLRGPLRWRRCSQLNCPQEQGDPGSGTS